MTSASNSDCSQPVDDEPAIRCAEWAREQRLRMIGTAGPTEGYLLVRRPLPWPEAVEDLPEFASVVPALRAQNVRLQLVVPVTEDVPVPRAILFRRTKPFRGFTRTETNDAGDIAGVIHRLLGQDARSMSTVTALSDVLVCAHGTRDVCCGSYGTRLAVAAASDPALATSGVRLWRTSHTGGHRFAPTAISLPDGVVWGNLTPVLLSRVILRSDGCTRDLDGHVRGCSGLQSRSAQLLDERAFYEHGWGWLSWTRHEVAMATHGLAQLDAHSPDGAFERWEGIVSEGRELPTPVCRAPLSASTKTQRELMLSAFRSRTEV